MHGTSQSGKGKWNRSGYIASWLCLENSRNSINVCAWSGTPFCFDACALRFGFFSSCFSFIAAHWHGGEMSRMRCCTRATEQPEDTHRRAHTIRQVTTRIRCPTPAFPLHCTSPLPVLFVRLISVRLRFHQSFSRSLCLRSQLRHISCDRLSNADESTSRIILHIIFLRCLFGSSRPSSHAATFIGALTRMSCYDFSLPDLFVLFIFGSFRFLSSNVRGWFSRASFGIFGPRLSVINI